VSKLIKRLIVKESSLQQNFGSGGHHSHTQIPVKKVDKQHENLSNEIKD